MCPPQGLCPYCSLSLECSSPRFLVAPFLTSFKLNVTLPRRLRWSSSLYPPTPILLPCPTSCFYIMNAILSSYWFTVHFSQLECQLWEARDLKLCCSGLCFRSLEQLLPHSRCSINTCTIWRAETFLHRFWVAESIGAANLERHLEVCIISRFWQMQPFHIWPSHSTNGSISSCSKPEDTALLIVPLLSEASSWKYY